MPQLLLELFSEEIPARMQAGAARDLERMAREKLTAAGLNPSSLTAFAGPRRLTLVAEDLPAAQGDVTEELKGPRAGAPPQALEGFLRKTGLTHADLVERDGVYYATLTKTGGPTTAIIAAMVEEIVRGFPWPKSMKWGSGTLRWVRPLKRILCVFDRQVVPFEIDGIASADLSEGHRFMGSGQVFRARDLTEYREALAGHYVVADPAERKAAIVKRARALCAAKGLELVEDDGLLEEVGGLAEWPTPVLGDMDPAFLTLPPEVIRTSMRTHQKYFAVRLPGIGNLAPHFVTVANIEASDGGAAIAAGNARVLSARLNDARFFWDEDIKAGFEPWLAKLDGVTFHAKLGTMAQRVERIVALASEIAPLVGADPAKAAEAARLAKGDLSSLMVGEFPELQGLMGGYYARAAGMDGEIADAIRDHYRPMGPSDSVPTAPVSIAVALADKLDTLVGFFAIDEKPTGSKDPYALRRAALGIIRILQANASRTGLGALVRASHKSFLDIFTSAGALRFKSSTGSYRMADDMTMALKEPAEHDAYWYVNTQVLGNRKLAYEPARMLDAQFKDVLNVRFFDLDEVSPSILAFFAERLKVALRDQGKRHDLVDAVFALGDDDLVRITARVEALDAFLRSDNGANLLVGYKRATNILRAEEKKEPLPTGPYVDGGVHSFEEDQLVAFVNTRTADVEAAVAEERYEDAMRFLSELRSPLDAFFEKVLVNSDVAVERDNRLRLLAQVRDLMGRVADFSLVSG